MSRLYPRLVVTLRLYCGSNAVAEDLASETVVRVIQHWTTVSRCGSPEAWTYRVAFNLANSRVRRLRVERRLGRSLESDLRQRQHKSGSADVERRVDVEKALQRLTAQQCRVIVLRYYVDMTTRQIAQVLGCREATVRVHLHDGQKRLREELDR
jgi:RNA polymerase sigma-70 factor (ECF subfamily)